MKKLRLDIVVGTRPEIIRLSRVIDKADQFFNLRLIHTGQNYDPNLSEIFFNELSIRSPDIVLDCAGLNAAHTVAKVIQQTSDLFEQDQPDALLILGDTNSCLCAFSAKRKKIPIFHMEAGNRCFDVLVPEEINRKLIDHLSDINLPYSSIARDFLIGEGFPSDQIIKIGSPMREVITFYQEQIEKSDILESMSLSAGNFVLFSAHREENVDGHAKIKHLLSVLEVVRDHFDMPVLVSTHPRLRNQLASHQRPDKVIFHDPFGFFDYCKLQMNAKIVLSDSGTITEEASILGFNAINLRDSHERHEGMEEATVLMSGLNCHSVLQCISMLENESKKQPFFTPAVIDYQPENVSSKVVRVVQSYTHFVNQKVWKKNQTLSQF